MCIIYHRIQKVSRSGLTSCVFSLRDLAAQAVLAVQEQEKNQVFVLVQSLVQVLDLDPHQSLLPDRFHQKYHLSFHIHNNHRHDMSCHM